MSDNRVVLAADNSQVIDFMRCPRLWYYKYVRRIEPVGVAYLPFDRGTLVHALLDQYYRLMVESPQKSTIELASEAITRIKKIDDTLALDPEERSLIFSRMLMYGVNYSNDNFRPLVINGKPQVELGFSIPLLDDENFYFVLEGRIDLITKDEWFVDHKTRSGKTELYKYSPQFLTYSLVTGLSQGCINYFGLTKTPDKDTFSRVPFSTGYELRERWRAKLITVFKRMAAVRDSGNAEMNESACQEPFGRVCRYAELDEISDDNFREKLIRLQYKETEKWEPWKMTAEESLTK